MGWTVQMDCETPPCTLKPTCQRLHCTGVGHTNTLLKKIKARFYLVFGLVSLKEQTHFPASFSGLDIRDGCHVVVVVWGK